MLLQDGKAGSNSDFIISGRVARRWKEGLHTNDTSILTVSVTFRLISVKVSGCLGLSVLSSAALLLSTSYVYRRGLIYLLFDLKRIERVKCVCVSVFECVACCL